MTESALSTMDCGRILGELLVPGDFIALVGDLGAGKTQFVKGVAQGLVISADEPVCSPSYTILNIHQGRIPLYHFDLYRLNDDSQVRDLGFDEYFEGNGVSVVEWADRMGDQIPHDNLSVVFTVEGPERRRLCFKPNGERSNELLRLLSAALP
jgi:tRNA threonylcarbamoyladenosine biosynthesis protein TsaE